MAAHTCHPSSPEVEAKRLGVQGHFQIYTLDLSQKAKRRSIFRFIMSSIGNVYKSPLLKTKHKKKRINKSEQNILALRNLQQQGLECTLFSRVHTLTLKVAMF